MIGGYGSIVKGIDSRVSFRLFFCGDASAMSFVEEREMNLWQLLEEVENKNFFNRWRINYILWKKVLLVYLGDFWLMTLFSGMWDPYLWEELSDSDEDSPLNSL